MRSKNYKQKSRKGFFSRRLSRPEDQMEGKILVTGASGYIGGLVMDELLASKYSVRGMIRTPDKENNKRWKKAEIVQADVLDYSSLKKATNGIHTAFYLIHSLGKSKGEFEEMERDGARNFRRCAEENGIKRIIYLGGLGEESTALSAHLKSRFAVGRELQSGKVPVTFLKAAIILGTGSASFQIVAHLVRNLPMFLLPTWGKSKCQPISIRDVIEYLIGCLENPETTGKEYDIGGPEILTYSDLLRTVADVLHKKIWFIESPLSSIPLYSSFIRLITSVPKIVTKNLLESVQFDVVCRNDSIKKVVDVDLLTIRESIYRAFMIEHAIAHRKGYISSKRIEKSLYKMNTFPIKRSKNVLTDIRHFLLNPPIKKTFVKIRKGKERQDYNKRILQRLGINTEDFIILNVHQIGIDIPAKFVFEELLEWDGDSYCWPNHIARVTKQEGLEKIKLYLFGRKKMPAGSKIKPLFNLNAIRIGQIPEYYEPDHARYLLYSCTGGYPIGFFSMYVRSSLADRDEPDMSQLFLVVGFNFFGNKRLSRFKPLSFVWAAIHNRVTSNIVNRIKSLAEWKFVKFCLSGDLDRS